jgi:hypothetical protein
MGSLPWYGHDSVQNGTGLLPRNTSSEPKSHLATVGRPYPLVKPAFLRLYAVGLAIGILLTHASVRGDDSGKYGPSAALAFSRAYRGTDFKPDELTYYPNAVGIPFADCENIIPMSEAMWTPQQISADFRRRMGALPPTERKKGIIVMLKTERCASREIRLCSTTTAALEKRATSLVAEFLIYGLVLKPRDRDTPPGSLKIETGADAWKNDAAGEYLFKQGPGATLAFLDPADGSLLDHTNARRLKLTEENFARQAGHTPELHSKLQEILSHLRRLSSG